MKFLSSATNQFLRRAVARNANALRRPMASSMAVLAHPTAATTPASRFMSSGKMDTLKSGTAAYMDLYPEQSTDGALRLGNIVPDFACETTQGYWESFHDWKKGKWAILFSHPADFTPVCTTEIGRLALKYDYLQSIDCLVATLSVDPVKSHNDWLQDVVAHCENKIEVSA